MFTCHSITREIGGKSVELTLDMRAVFLIEKHTGKNLMGDFWDNLTASDIVTTFWASASRHDKKLTLDSVQAAAFKEAVPMLNAIRAAWRASNELPAEDDRPTSGYAAKAKPE